MFLCVLLYGKETGVSYRKFALKTEFSVNIIKSPQLPDEYRIVCFENVRLFEKNGGQIPAIIASD